MRSAAQQKTLLLILLISCFNALLIQNTTSAQSFNSFQLNKIRERNFANESNYKMHMRAMEQNRKYQIERAKIEKRINKENMIRQSNLMRHHKEQNRQMKQWLKTNKKANTRSEYENYDKSNNNYENYIRQQNPSYYREVSDRTMETQIPGSNTIEPTKMAGLYFRMGGGGVFGHSYIGSDMQLNKTGAGFDKKFEGLINFELGFNKYFEANIFYFGLGVGVDINIGAVSEFRNLFSGTQISSVLNEIKLKLGLNIESQALLRFVPYLFIGSAIEFYSDIDHNIAKNYGGTIGAGIMINLKQYPFGIFAEIGVPVIFNDSKQKLWIGSSQDSVKETEQVGFKVVAMPKFAIGISIGI